jgi:hypothetical protein
MSATLQTMVGHCTSNDKDSWNGPVGCDGCPARSPLVYTAGTNPTNAPAAYNAMEQFLFNYHLSRWWNSLSDLAEKCVICHKLAQEKKHPTAKCHILKKLGIKIQKQSAADNSNKSAAPAPVASEGSSTPTPPPAPAPARASDTGGGSRNISGACTASTEAETYNSGDEFDSEGKY